MRPAALLLLAPLLLGAEEERRGSGISPALDLLPEGSTLRNVSLPRYDEDKNPSALLRADLMRVVTENHVSGENVEMRMFAPDATTTVRVHMGAAEYFVDTGVLEATEVLTLRGDSYRARGTGALFQLNARRGFIHGPVSTLFEGKPATAETSMNTTTSSFLAFTALVAGGVRLAEPPEALTEAERALFDQRALPSSPVHRADSVPAKRALIRSEQLSQSADFSFRSFATEAGHPELLLIANPAPEGKKDGPLQLDAKQTLITCDGGMFFDVEKSHAVYLKNVVVKQPDFTLTAAKELKIFLAKKEVAAGEEEKTGIDAFSDIDTIVATGGVKLVRKNEKGETLIATADTATYEAKSGDIVLRGGFPRIQQDKNFVQAKEAGLYVRIYANGKGFFEEGQWETQIQDLKQP